MGSRISVPPQQSTSGSESISAASGTNHHHHGYHAGNSTHYRSNHPPQSSSLITATNCYVRGSPSSPDGYRSGISARPRSLSSAANVIGELSDLDNQAYICVSPFDDLGSALGSDMIPSSMDGSSLYPLDLFSSRSFPSQFMTHNGLKCPVCSKQVQPVDMEYHLLMCLTKPNRLSYNEDVLKDNKGECVICLEDLLQGETIARLPCLCIYHKSCIDSWFQVNRSCPEHPSD